MVVVQDEVAFFGSISVFRRRNSSVLVGRRHSIGRSSKPLKIASLRMIGWVHCGEEGMSFKKQSSQKKGTNTD